MKDNILNDELENIFSKPATFYENKIIKANRTFKFDQPVIIFGAAKMGMRFFDQIGRAHV